MGRETVGNSDAAHTRGGVGVGRGKRQGRGRSGGSGGGSAGESPSARVNRRGRRKAKVGYKATRPPAAHGRKELKATEARPPRRRESGTPRQQAAAAVAAAGRGAARAVRRAASGGWVAAGGGHSRSRDPGRSAGEGGRGPAVRTALCYSVPRGSQKKPCARFHYVPSHLLSQILLVVLGKRPIAPPGVQGTSSPI